MDIKIEPHDELLSPNHAGNAYNSDVLQNTTNSVWNEEYTIDFKVPVKQEKIIDYNDRHNTKQDVSNDSQRVKLEEEEIQHPKFEEIKAEMFEFAECSYSPKKSDEFPTTNESSALTIELPPKNTSHHKLLATPGISKTHLKQEILREEIMLENVETVENIDSDGSDLEFEKTDNISDTEDFVEVQYEENSDLEVSEVDEEDDTGKAEGEEGILYTSRHGFHWSSIPPSSRFQTLNTPTEDSGLINSSKDVTSIKDMFCLFLNDETVKVIVEETNRHLLRKDPEKTNPILSDEFYAFVGVLLASGRNRTRKTDLSDLWISESPFCQPFFTAALSRYRFIQIYSSVRFDNKKTRQERFLVSSDKLEPIKWVFNQFVEACKLNYSPSSNITVDERLVRYKGNCPFRVCMKTKPVKYGIKIWVAADSSSGYVTNLEVYTGMKNNRLEVNQGYRVVTKLVKPQYGSNRTVTTGNFFTSVNLADELLSKKLTLTGTIRRNKKQIPSQFLPAKQKEMYSSMFGFADNKTVVSYVTDKNKAVILLSTQINGADVDNSELKKPLIIHHYNETKNGVDKGDQMMKEYSCVRSTRRWPFRVFMEIIDIAVLNAYLLWIKKYPEWKEKKKCRRKHFIRELSLELAKPNIIKRKNSNVKHHRQQQDAFNTVLSYCGEIIIPDASNNTFVSPRQAQKRGSCGFCSKYSRKRSKLFCNICKEPVCSEHRTEKKIVSCPSCHQLSSLE